MKRIKANTEIKLIMLVIAFSALLGFFCRELVEFASWIWR